MTDETREQLDTDALSAWQEEKGANIHTWTIGDNDDEARYWRSIYIKGATHQHSISFEQGRKDAINNAIDIAMEYREAFETYARHNELIQQLESLRNEKV